MNNIDKVILDNGLTIYFYLDERRHSSFFQFITLFGGVTKDFIYNDKEYHMQDGIAHILEHYLVECNDSGNFLEELGKMQMNTNASTHQNMTRFYFETVKDLEIGINKMLYGLTHINFTDEKLEKLKNPIYQEIRGKMDSKFYHSNNMMMDNLFSSIKFKNIGGTLDEVKNTTVEDIRTCYEAFYTPSNQIIVLAGNFNKDSVLKTIKDIYKDLDIPKNNVSLIKSNERKEVNKESSILYYPTPLDYVGFSFKINVSDITSEEKLDLDFYLSCFYKNFFGVTSNTYKYLTENKIISGSVSCGNTFIDDYLIINIGTYTYDCEAFKEKILDTIRKMSDFDEEYFDLDKRSAIIRLILRDENIMKMIMPFVDNIVNFDYPYLDEVKDVDKLKYKDYVKAIKKLDFSNYTVITIKEKED